MTRKDNGAGAAVPGVVLITGAAQRIGAAIAGTLHAEGWNVVVHARRSMGAAQALVEQLEAQRPDSAVGVSADLADAQAIEALAQTAANRWGRLDALVNNASSYFPTPMGSITAGQVDDLIASNLRGPLLLTQACLPHLHDSRGCVVNILDTQIPHPPAGYAAYFAAKGGLWTLTQALAVELAPRVRVNGVAPGHMIWATHSAMDAEQQQRELARIPLGRLGGADEIARTVRYLLSADAAYMTGAILPVDGGLALT